MCEENRTKTRGPPRKKKNPQRAAPKDRIGEREEIKQNSRWPEIEKKVSRRNARAPYKSRGLIKLEHGPLSPGPPRARLSFPPSPAPRAFLSRFFFLTVAFLARIYGHFAFGSYTPRLCFVVDPRFFRLVEELLRGLLEKCALQCVALCYFPVVNSENSLDFYFTSDSVWNISAS